MIGSITQLAGRIQERAERIREARVAVDWEHPEDPVPAPDYVVITFVCGCWEECVLVGSRGGGKSDWCGSCKAALRDGIEAEVERWYSLQS